MLPQKLKQRLFVSYNFKPSRNKVKEKILIFQKNCLGIVLAQTWNSSLQLQKTIRGSEGIWKPHFSSSKNKVLRIVIKTILWKGY